MCEPWNSHSIVAVAVNPSGIPQNGPIGGSKCACLNVAADPWGRDHETKRRFQDLQANVGKIMKRKVCLTIGEVVESMQYSVPLLCLA